MKIKKSKTKIVKFNFSQNFDFPPEVQVDGFKNELEVISHTKLLGVYISNDLKWAVHTDYICKKAYKRVWIIRRLKCLDISPAFILDV